MATIPIYNPMVPFLGNIPGGLQAGQSLRIKGQMNHGHSVRFNINIQRGPSVSPKDDVALHLSVRPANGQIVRNHMLNQQWFHEETYGGCPIYPGQIFDILITAEHAFYKITVNNAHFCTFNHRLPLHSSGYFVQVEGDCSIMYIGRENDFSGPTFNPPPNPVPPIFGGPGGYPHATPYGGGAPPYQGPPAHHHHHHHHTTVVPSPPPPPPPSIIYPPMAPPPYSSHNYSTSAPIYTASPPAYSTSSTIHTPPPPYKKKKNKALKYAAGIGAAGLGVYAVSQIVKSSKSSSSSSSDSD